ASNARPAGLASSMPPAICLLFPGRGEAGAWPQRSGRPITPYSEQDPCQGTGFMAIHQVELEIGGRTLSIQTGKVAKQADGAVLVQYGETVVLGAAVRAAPREGVD